MPRLASIPRTNARPSEDFARRGGIVIITVGTSGPAQAAGSYRSSVSKWGCPRMRKRRTERRGKKPAPLGHFKSPFFNGGDYYAFVRFHAAWPVYCDDPKAFVVTEYKPGKAVIVVRRLRRGAVAVIGDTCFAMLKNLENEDGSPIEGLRENAVFWRWFLAFLGGGEPWYPPKPQIEEPADSTVPPAAVPPAAARSPVTQPRQHPCTNRSEGMFAWIGLTLLSISWLLGLGYYHGADWHAWTLTVLGGTALLGTRFASARRACRYHGHALVGPRQVGCPAGRRPPRPSSWSCPPSG